MNLITPDVSILIAAFNAADTIRAAIDSALSQRGVTVEVVLCDDASTDATYRIVSDLAFIDPRIKALGHLENKGQSEALNTAAASAQGRYLMQLDADDTLAPDSLAPLVKALDEHPEHGFTYGCSWVKSQIEGIKSYVYTPPVVFDKTHFHRANASFYCVLYRREAFANGARYRDIYPPVRGSLQDWDFILQLTEGLHWSGLVLPDTLVLEYNFRPNTLYHRMKEHEEAVLAALKDRWSCVTAAGI